jgi:hypothetical protein
MSAPTLFDSLLSHRPPANDTSLEAAEIILKRMGYLQTLVLDALRDHGPLTPDEVATVACEDKLSIRPRFSELKSTGKIFDTGERRCNTSGRRAIVWAVTETV